MNGDDIAFPGDSREARQFAGLSKREEFARTAMQGLLARQHSNCCTDKWIASAAVKHADALIAELSKVRP